jgi:hypothetical protein
MSLVQTQQPLASKDIKIYCNSNVLHDKTEGENGAMLTGGKMTFIVSKVTRVTYSLGGLESYNSICSPQPHSCGSFLPGHFHSKQHIAAAMLVLICLETTSSTLPVPGWYKAP